MMAHRRAEAAGGRKAPRHEVAVSWALPGSERYGDYMSGGTVKPDFCELFLPCFFAFTVSFVRPRCRLSSAPTVDFGRRCAQKLSRSAVAPPQRAHFDVSRPRLDSFEHGGRLDDYGPEERSVVEFLYVFSVCFGMLVVGGFSVDIHVAFDGRISLY